MRENKSRFHGLLNRMGDMNVVTFTTKEAGPMLGISKVDLKLLNAYGVSTGRLRMALSSGDYGRTHAVYELVNWRTKWMRMKWRSDDGQLTNEGA